MSEDGPKNANADTVTVEATEDDFEALAKSIVDDCIFNIVHETVLSVHRSEKLLRMQSAAAEVEIEAYNKAPDTTPAKDKAVPPPQINVQTPGAIYDNGRIHLQGNPLKTTPDIMCPNCRLPRLKFPIKGVGAQVPDTSIQYCTRHPFVQREGHDIYNNPFPSDQPKTKKEKELMKQQQRAEKDGTPNSQDTGTPPDGCQKIANNLSTGSKPANYVPWHTCPNCKRSILITRFAMHMGTCLGLSGRASSRSANQKINSQNGATPVGSRPGTPGPLNPSSKRGADDDGDEDETPQKKKKKSNYVKKADREKLLAKAQAGAKAQSQAAATDSSQDKKGADETQSTQGDGEKT